MSSTIALIVIGVLSVNAFAFAVLWIYFSPFKERESTVAEPDPGPSLQKFSELAALLMRPKEELRKTISTDKTAVIQVLGMEDMWFPIERSFLHHYTDRYGVVATKEAIAKILGVDTSTVELRYEIPKEFLFNKEHDNFLLRGTNCDFMSALNNQLSDRNVRSMSHRNGVLVVHMLEESIEIGVEWWILKRLNNNSLYPRKDVIEYLGVMLDRKDVVGFQVRRSPKHRKKGSKGKHVPLQ